MRLSAHSVSAARHFAVASLFVAYISIAFIKMIHGVHRVTQPAAAASLSWASWEKFCASARDVAEAHFGGRYQARRLHTRLQHGLFAASPHPLVMHGKNGWLHYASAAEQACIRRLRPFTRRELEAWRRSLESQSNYVKDHNGAFIFMVAPDKHTIYPETLPIGLANAAPSRADQLIAYLRKHSNVLVVDPTGALLAAAKSQRVYHRTDTHWNALGGLVAYSALMPTIAALFPGTVALSQHDYVLTDAGTTSTDLADMLGLGRVESVDILQNRTTTPAKITAPSAGVEANARSKVSHYSSDGPRDAPIQRLVVMGDSFRTQLIPHLAQHARHGIYPEAHELDPDFILNYKPNLVIHEIVERLLYDPDPPLPVEPFHGVLFADGFGFLERDGNDRFRIINRTAKLRVAPAPGTQVVECTVEGNVFTFGVNGRELARIDASQQRRTLRITLPAPAHPDAWQVVDVATRHVTALAAPKAGPVADMRKIFGRVYRASAQPLPTVAASELSRAGS